MVYVVIDMEIKMKPEIASFEMFTSAGDRMVADLVTFAKTHGLSSDVVMDMMSAISKDECFGEITDTAVRECIGEELGWYE
jgi:hypothetical protein